MHAATQEITCPDRWIGTASHRQFTFGNGNLTDVDLRDIAKHLSKTCRFAGATREFYSVAQHSVLMAATMRTDGYDAFTQFHGLLHDAHEYVLGDIPTPLAHHINDLAGWDLVGHLKDDADKIIFAQLKRDYGFEPPTRVVKEIISDYDEIMFVTEVARLFDGELPDYVKERIKRTGLAPRDDIMIRPSASWAAEVDWMHEYLRIITAMGFEDVRR